MISLEYILLVTLSVRKYVNTIAGIFAGKLQVHNVMVNLRSYSVLIPEMAEILTPRTDIHRCMAYGKSTQPVLERQGVM
jgi:hypothetical protein